MRLRDAKALVRKKYPNAMEKLTDDGRDWTIIAEGEIIGSGSTCECAWIDIAIRLDRRKK